MASYECTETDEPTMPGAVGDGTELAIRSGVIDPATVRRIIDQLVAYNQVAQDETVYSDGQ